jgi:hypothetical protein
LTIKNRVIDFFKSERCDARPNGSAGRATKTITIPADELRDKQKISTQISIKRTDDKR